MKRISLIFAIMFLPTALSAAQIASVKYIHDYITKNKGVTVAAKETNTAKAANAKYLLCAVDKVNAALKCPVTTYCTNALATTRAVDTAAVADAMTRLAKTGAAAYQVVDYLTFTGTQHVNTGIVPTYMNTKITTSYSLTAIPTSTQVVTGARNVVGNENSDGTVLFIDSKNVFFDYWHATRFTLDGFNSTSFYTLTMDSNKLYLNGTLRSTRSPARSGAITQTLFIGATNDAGSVANYPFKGKIKAYDIYKSGSLVFQGVPVKRISDGAYGYFDKVSKTFKGNSGTGTLGGSATITGYLTSTGTSACN